jgi:hypothetical protein
MLAVVDVSLMSIYSICSLLCVGFQSASLTSVVANFYLAAIRGTAVTPYTEVNAIERGERDSFYYGRREGR